MNSHEPSTTVSPYLAYPDADAAAEWLRRVLGFGPVRVSRDDDGPAARGVLVVHVDDVDDQYRRLRRAGAEPTTPEDKPSIAYTYRSGHLANRSGSTTSRMYRKTISRVRT